MSNTHSNHEHHRHHRHEHIDDALRFQRRSLNSIVLRKKIAKWGFRVLFVIAVLMVIATIVVYNIR